ncbi:hypothetical protein C7974DRAFT_471550 [Boeremia exigua]|uniref:uncharacterized protein n=1 Tax=Boeremia exigua TaxID=749465 RepID=UPI001E8EDE07|nr:uncharacterized protein C7974DRAFT_471550 [Boeremia exigua]KAH6633398.1 hypothetical protein C7974DRAFT_471550 [Boeremia exigua]
MDEGIHNQYNPVNPETPGNPRNPVNPVNPVTRLVPHGDENEALRLTHETLRHTYPNVPPDLNTEVVFMLHPARYLPPAADFVLVQGRQTVGWPMFATGHYCRMCFQLQKAGEICSQPCNKPCGCCGVAHSQLPCPRAYNSLNSWYRSGFVSSEKTLPKFVQAKPGMKQFKVLKLNGYISTDDVFDEHKVPEFNKQKACRTYGEVLPWKFSGEVHVPGARPVLGRPPKQNTRRPQPGGNSRDWSGRSDSSALRAIDRAFDPRDQSRSIYDSSVRGTGSGSNGSSRFDGLDPNPNPHGDSGYGGPGPIPYNHSGYGGNGLNQYGGSWQHIAPQAYSTNHHENSYGMGYGYGMGPWQNTMPSMQHQYPGWQPGIPGRYSQMPPPPPPVAPWYPQQPASAMPPDVHFHIHSASPTVSGGQPVGTALSSTPASTVSPSTPTLAPSDQSRDSSQIRSTNRNRNSTGGGQHQRQDHGVNGRGRVRKPSQPRSRR